MKSSHGQMRGEDFWSHEELFWGYGASHHYGYLFGGSLHSLGIWGFSGLGVPF